VGGPAHLKSHAILSGLATDSMTVTLQPGRAQWSDREYHETPLSFKSTNGPAPPQQVGGYLP
jgi:hypothetical protein